MPVQINEVIIRAVVDSPGGSQPADAASGGVSAPETVSERELAEKILAIIKEKKER